MFEKNWLEKRNRDRNSKIVKGDSTCECND